MKRPPVKVRFLSWQRLADGRWKGHWKPSPRLRKAGWTNLDLGTDIAAAVGGAMARNAELELWQAAAAQSRDSSSAARAALPRRWTFADLADDYLRSDTFAGLAVKTRAEYRSKIKWLMRWAQDGATQVRAIDEDMCIDLRNILVARDSAWTAASRLRVLRLLLQYAVRPLRIIDANPARELDIPEPKPRHKRLPIEALAALHAAAVDAPGGGAALALAVALGFYTAQREGDLLAATRVAWREIEDIAAEDRATLAGVDGRVMGLRIRQQKTGTWVDVFVPTTVRDEIEAALVGYGSGHAGPLLLDIGPDGVGRDYPEWKFQRLFRGAVEFARLSAIATGDKWLTDQLTGLQFRDLRRSGMCWLRDLGCTIPQIASISGHSIAYTKKILDTYMPADTRASAAGMAHAVRRQGQRDAIDKKQQG